MPVAVCKNCSSRVNIADTEARSGIRCKDCGAEMIISASAYANAEAGDAPAKDAADPMIGLVFDGCRITRKIADGGMGSVYKARHLILGKDVAIKVLNPDLAFDRDYTRRFLSEAKLAASLDHPNIVQVYDVGKEHNRYYIHMQYIDGKSLADILADKKRLPLSTALKVAAHTAGALYAAHKQNLIHRDIKPGNILITRTGAVKLADFGLAKDINTNRELTQSGQIIGTPYFMSPEQCKGTKLTFHTDHYSLGATLFYALTGDYPFDSDNTITVLYNHMEKPLAFSPEHEATIPAHVRALIEKMMAKNPAERFPTTKHLQHALYEAYKIVKGRQDDSALEVEDAPAPAPTDTASAASTRERLCPCCGGAVLAAASKCKHCGEWIHTRPTFAVRALGLFVDIAVMSLVVAFLSQLLGRKMPPVVPLMTPFFYNALCLHFLKGRTVGKLLLNMRVVRENHEPLPSNDIVMRSALYYLSFVTLGIGFLLPAFRYDGKTLHDLLSNSMVILDSRKKTE